MAQLEREAGEHRCQRAEHGDIGRQAKPAVTPDLRNPLALMEGHSHAAGSKILLCGFHASMLGAADN
jgi:hypothetical protein